jgi:hypothetical protein
LMIVIALLMKLTIQWDMKIIMKIINKPVRDLLEADYNPRQLTEKQYKDLQSSIKEFGFVDPIIINKRPERKNIIIGGHQRYKVAKMLGLEKVPCVELDLSVEKEQELNVRLNKNTGEWDYDVLANHFDTTELLDWGFVEAELGIKKEDLEFIATADDKELLEYPEDLNDSEVKMVQLFFNAKQKKVFDEWIDMLIEEFGTKNATDTILKYLSEQS